MKVFGIAGHSGMGKTTLLERLVPVLRARGLSVSVVKHSHKEIEVDRPGKDSYRLREAGCGEVLLMGRRRWALMHEQADDLEPPLEALLGHLSPCSLVLVEGFKQGEFPKLEVWRAAGGKPPLWPYTPGVVALAGDPADARPAGAPCFLALDSIGGIADLVLARARAFAPARVTFPAASRPGGPAPLRRRGA